MQTFKVPYTTDDAGKALLSEVRRVQSAVIRSAYAMAHAEDGSLRKQPTICQLLKDRYRHEEVLDSWSIHCGTKLGFTKRKMVPDGGMIFGGKKDLQRRNKGLISNEEWKLKRLQPFVSYGDSQKPFGNQNVQLLDSHTLLLKIGRIVNGKIRTDEALLHLRELTGNAGYIIRLVAGLCGATDQKNRINVTYLIDEQYVCITVDPEDLAHHPERLTPVQTVRGRCLGVDLNPNFVGLAVAQNRDNASKLSLTSVLEHELVQFDFDKKTSAELVRETLAGLCERMVSMCRKWSVGTIVLEDGLGKLRSQGKNKEKNRLLNYWARTILLNMLKRKAGLAGIKVLTVWSGYSTTIGNLWFELPDACASATELARRGLARQAGKKNVLPDYEEGWRHGQWKDLSLPAKGVTWKDVHQAIKTAKIGYRRPHPTLSEPDTLKGAFAPSGYAVRRLNHRHRPGWIYLARGRGSDTANSRLRGGVVSSKLNYSTRKSE